ncbi:hypothetical protein CAPTEDRAFT_203407 [Capitella teleta]|uniref:Uncharacterized protein n=1 Tax=Capitella teleta TaxID=283909 RepID=R7VA93_CAPTE|nr:hypothetical protein CAPTEDRAFT_203407 [Capitella teleta]|eukprot:ELU15457.1 hypothetical protein CAPTEDRAFT_203407 [Capitella teleta]
MNITSFGPLLPSHDLLAMAPTQLSSNGMSFELQTSDEVKVTVMLQEPVQEYLDGVVEVHGMVDQRLQIQCQQYVNFSSSTAKFDMKTYDKAIQLMHKHPQHYLTGNPAPVTF